MYNLFFIIGLIIIFIIIIKFFKTPKGKGIIGEFIINISLKLFLNKKYYKILNNVLLKYGNTTTQIDHIIISKYGIFVLESKNYKGYIYGNRYEKEWIQKTGYKEYKFQNPLYQNYKHIRAIQNILKINKKYFISVIVFSNRAKFKTQMPPNILYSSNYIKYIKSFKKPILSQKAVEDIFLKLDRNRLKNSFKNKKIHIKNVEKILESKK